MTTDIFTAEDIQDLYEILCDQQAETLYECNMYKGSTKEKEAMMWLECVLSLKKKISDRYSWNVNGVMTDLKTGEKIEE